MNVLQCGTEVQTKIDKLNAIITGVCIRHDSIDYNVSYFHNGEHKDVWLYEDELIIKDHKSLNIGFVKQ